jgi:hypothetical protein
MHSDESMQSNSSPIISTTKKPPSTYKTRTPFARVSRVVNTLNRGKRLENIIKDIIVKVK